MEALLAGERPLSRLAFAFGALLVLTLAGTTGYVIVEGASWFDSLYMTVLTLSTVGYGEIIPLSHAGRLFTMGLIVSGVGTAAYFVASMVQLLAVNVLSKLVAGVSMQKQLDRIRDHVIVCGYGRFGKIVVEELMRGSVPIVIVERDPNKHCELEQSGKLYVIGDATMDDVLASAGLARARAIVAGTGSDPDNVFISLAAREHRSDIRIHARGESPESIRRMKQAGADYVLSAYQMGGVSLAASILRPAVAQFLEIARPRVGHAVDLEEVRVLSGARLIGKDLASVERDHPRLRIVALMRGERTELIPDSELRLAAGDFLVVIGERQALEQLATHAAS